MYTHCSFQCLQKKFYFETSLFDRSMTGNLHSNCFFFPNEWNGDEWNVFFSFPHFFLHHMISHFPLVVFGKFCVHLSSVMGGNCRDVVPFSVTHPIYSWFGSECGVCGPHREGKIGQICTIFRNPHAGFSHKNSQYSRQAVVRTI